VRRVLLAATVLLAACGDDAGDDGASGTYDVVLVVGAAVADEAADPAGFPGEGSTFEERWTLDCDDRGCVLGRPDGGALLGTLDDLELVETETGWQGVATGVQPEPAVEADDEPCAGSPVQTWTVTVDLSERDGALVGSVFRVPDALVDGDCFGLDLTLGLSATELSRR